MTDKKPWRGTPIDEIMARTWWHVGGADWFVKKCDGGTSIPDAQGVCDYARRTMEIAGNLSRPIAFRTLLHELAHAAGLGEAGAMHAEIIAGVLLDNEGGAE